ncbi:hypothetical protein [uncultured Methanoregula sp.]|uniref:hypothetical protein n=1 Tax=uncultured Methanoregula sp. TaxID=1005933 RepID=UPI002AAAC409|nr:hypothetical protein [uncultured Methanoregula sp.]
MTRGRLPVRAQEVADPIAGKRGKVQHYQYEPGVTFSFTIFGKNCDAHVRIKCVRRLGCTVRELERELADILAAIRLTASGPGISRELWLCSPRYALRFFRVDDDRLVELDKDGAVLPASDT